MTGPMMTTSAATKPKRNRQDRYLGWGEDQRMWKYLQRAGVRVGLYRRQPGDCQIDTCTSCNGDCAHRKELRRRLLQRIVDDDVPSGTVWVRSPDDPEMIFTLSLPPDLDMRSGGACGPPHR